MKHLTAMLAFPVVVALTLIAHAGLARGLKAVLWSWAPLSEREPEAATYQRRVYHTATRPMLEVLAAAIGSGVLFGIAVLTPRFGGLVALAGLIALAATVALDISRWERVSASASQLWFQRGFGRHVHRIAFDDIRDLAVEETPARGFTLRRGTRNQLVRLTLRTLDKRVVNLPKTDAGGRGLEEVEGVANQIRMRLDHKQQRQRLADAQDEGGRAAQVAGSAVAARGDDLRLALARLRRHAGSPTLPPAVKSRREG